MLIKIEDKTVFEITPMIKKVICNDILEDIFDEDIERRVKYIVEHKFEQCMRRLKEEWIVKLTKAGIKSIPTSDLELAELIFSNPEYRSRKQREEEIALKEEAAQQ